MSLRWQFERTGRFKVPYKVEIYDSEYSGSVQTLDKVGADPVTLVMGTQNADPLDKIKASYISVEFVGKTGDFEDLFTRDNQRFLLKLFIDGNFYSEFIPVTNEFSDTVTEGVYTNSIRCANLAVLKQVKIKEIFTTDERISKLEGLHRIVTHMFDMDVVDGSILYPSGANTNASALNQIDFNTGRFDDQTAYEALQWLTPKMHQLRVWDGAVFMIPVNEASFTGYRYNGSSITSSVYNDNFTGIFKGGRLGIDREKLRVYDSVLRNYEPGEAPNIVPNGDLDDLENFTYTTAPIGNLRFGLPNGWTIAQGDTPWLIRNTGIESDPYRGEINVGNSIYQALTDIEIIEDQNLRVNVNVEFNSTRDVVWCLPVKVKVGDYVAQIDYGIEGSRLTGTGELSWELESEVDNPFLFVLGNSGRIINFSQQLPPLPATGTASFQVASPLPFLNVVTPYNQNVDPDDRAFLYNFALDAVDEEGDIILRSETEAGESGDVYEYTEQFGDGFTSVNPGALFFNGQQTLNWSVKGYSGTGSLADVQTSYLLSELSRDRDRISGNVDTFDTIALIEGKRVNYISTNFRKGNSKIELVEIVSHDLDAVPEDRRERGGGKPQIGERFDNEDFFPFSRINSIGVLREDIEEEERTSVRAEFDIVARKGIEYWIVNEAELSRADRQAGIYPINPVTTDSGGDPLFPGDVGYEDGTKEYGPGLLEALPIQSTLINAPEGSLIYKAPGQTETEQNVGEELDREFDERIETVNLELDQLELDLIDLDNALTELNTVTLPALNDDLDQLETDLNELNTVTIPNLQAELDDVLPITETKIADDAISTPKLQTNSIVAGKIATGAITAIKIATDAVIANKIQAGAVVADKIGADAVTANKIAADAVTTNKIQAGAITTNKIGADQVTANKIDVDDLGANSAFIETLMAQTLRLRTGGVIESTSFSSGSSGFQITAAGDAEFNSVEIRSGGVQYDGDGLSLNTLGNANLSNSSLRWFDGGTAVASILTSDSLGISGVGQFNPKGIYIRGGSPNVSAEEVFNVVLATASFGNIALVPGSNGYLKLLNLPTSAPGGSNRVWNDGGTLRIT